MKLVWFTIIYLIILQICPLINGQKTFLDKLRPAYRVFRNTLFDFIGRSDSDSGYEWNLKRGKVQKQFPEDHQFFCDPQGPGRRSKIVPESVHKLRPGDIDIVGAIGDSLTAGNGALATNILQVLIENKGVSWSIGGQGTWQKFLTLPNMLKVYNPNIYGYSLSDGFSIQKVSRFNAAEIGAMSRDLPYEAKVIVKRMTTDSYVNIDEHWKMITILIGPNDFCLDLCYMSNPEKSIELHEAHLLQTLRTLRDNLPRLIINLVTPPSMKVLLDLVGKPLECISSHHFECPCIFGLKFEANRERYLNIIEQWKTVVEHVANMDEFHNKEDFTVVNQPFLKNVSIPKAVNGNSDYRYLSLDCFHLSQRGYALASNAFWNNLFEPYGSKSTNWKKEFTEVKCPTLEHPYIRTMKNS